jgi:hypothetical protein
MATSQALDVANAQFQLAQVRNAVERAAAQAQLAQALRNQKALQDQAQSSAQSAAVNNYAGQATSTHELTSDGIGTINVADSITFGVPFREAPFFLSSAAMVSKLDAAVTPRGSATVRSWVRDGYGNYVGAFVTLWVGPDQAIKTTTTTTKTSSDPDVAPVVKVVVQDDSEELKKAAYVMKHFLSFSGLAYKKLDDTVIDSMTSTVLKSTAVGG